MLDMGRMHPFRNATRKLPPAHRTCPVASQVNNSNPPLGSTCLKPRNKRHTIGILWCFFALFGIRALMAIFTTVGTKLLATSITNWRAICFVSFSPPRRFEHSQTLNAVQPPKLGWLATVHVNVVSLFRLGAKKLLSTCRTRSMTS